MIRVGAMLASPWQNGYVESFFGRFKHELDDLNRTALKMPPAVYAAQMLSNTCLHELST